MLRFTNNILFPSNIQISQHTSVEVLFSTTLPRRTEHSAPRSTVDTTGVSVKSADLSFEVCLGVADPHGDIPSSPVIEMRPTYRYTTEIIIVDGISGTYHAISVLSFKSCLFTAASPSSVVCVP